MDMDIEEKRSREKRYTMSSHLFTLPELKLLIDAVGSSKFITAKKYVHYLSRYRICGTQGTRSRFSKTLP